MKVSRHFVSLTGRWGNRQVHYRRAGRGPLVLMLHQSPQSSRELEPLMAEWAQNFTVVAPDSPGYGLSDPLGQAVATLDDFAAATVDFLDAIGAGRAGVYGFHTGGMIGIALGHRFPGRIAAVACNGVAILTAAERETILKDYLPPLVPRWDGGHLAWLWGRMREQSIFFPWHLPTAATRMLFPVPPAERLQAGLLEFLRAADHYHVAYRAAFVYPAEEVLAETGTPTLATAAQADPISPHLQRLPRLSPAVQVMMSANTPEALQRCREHLARHPGEALRDPPPAAALAGRLWSEMIPSSWGAIRIRRGGTVGEPPVVVLHGAGASGALLAAMAAELARGRPVLVPDLPGHGESDLVGESPRLTDLGAWLQELLATLGLARVHLVGVGGGAVAALALALGPRTARLADKVVVLNPGLPTGDQRALARAGVDRDGVDWYGGHLLRAWHTVRDSRLFYPWCRREPEGVRRHEPRLDPADIQAEVTELLKAGGNWQSLLEDELAYPLAQRAADPALAGRLLLGVVPGWPGHGAAETLAASAGLPLVTLATDPAQWGGPVAPFLA